MPNETGTKLLWAHGTISVECDVQKYRRFGRVTFTYTVRRHTEIIERDTSHSFRKICDRLTYFLMIEQPPLRRVRPPHFLEDSLKRLSGK